MGLDSAIFLVLLPVLALVHAFLGPKGRLALLLFASAAFYAFSGIAGFVILLTLVAANFAAARALAAHAEQGRRTTIFGAAVLADLAVLVAFKYLAPKMAAGLGTIGVALPAWDGPWRQMAPLGLSYFTFQMVGCLTDVYRRTWVFEASLPRFVLFGLFFPQITSGPIPRAGKLLPQFGAASATKEDVFVGARLIAFGLFKKFVIGNRLLEYVSVVFDSNRPFSAVTTGVGLCLNALQLYADFSGYSDIAIGSARLFGIRLDPNFDHPFRSVSVTEFWRRWHMTFSFWLRDYLFLPLRIRLRVPGNAGTVVAMVATFAVCGVWHGLTWPFLFLGLAHGTAMSVELVSKSWRTRKLKQAPKAWVTAAGWVYTLSFVVLAQALFRSDTLRQAGRVYASLLSCRGPASAAEVFGYAGGVRFGTNMALIAAWILGSWWLSRITERATPWFLAGGAALLFYFAQYAPQVFVYARF